MTESSITKSLVKKILEAPLGHDWTIQGLGMLRLYLDDKRRLHIWDEDYAVENVSKLHTHPWNFKSHVVAGIVNNYKFVEDERGDVFHRQSIFCGTGGGLEGSPDTVKLRQLKPKQYIEHESYNELAHEIHYSAPERGTVTIIKRDYLEDADHAFVFWKNGDWVSAEPRKATTSEILNIATYSLRRWFT